MATSTSGFFQEAPVLKNQYTGDIGLQRVLRYFVPDNVLHDIDAEFSRFGDIVVSKQVYEWLDDAERNLPFVQHDDTFGHQINRLVTSEGWRKLKELGIREGMLAIPYERKYKEYSRVVGFAKKYLFGCASAMVECPFAMTDGAARIIEVFKPSSSRAKETYSRVTSRDPDYAWTSGQWMTERPGGSDVSNTETIAIEAGDLGPNEYRLSGFKWFSSATDSQVSVLLGKTEGSNKLTCFMGYLEDGGVRIHRLKKKFGTAPLPTAELELKDFHGEIIGPENRGVATIATVLNLTRVHSAVSSLSNFRRALTIAREYSLVRKVFGKRLDQVPAHVKVLASEESKIRGMSYLTFYATSLLGKEETGQANTHEKTLLRIIAGITKALVCKHAPSGISECMEALGGIGYLEFDISTNIARLYRDAQVNSIWEGTTNVLCDDAVRFIKPNFEAVKQAIEWLFQSKNKNYQAASTINKKLQQDLQKWFNSVQSSSLDQLRYNSRDIVLELGRLVIVLLTADDLADQDPVTVEISRRWSNLPSNGKRLKRKDVLVHKN